MHGRNLLTMTALVGAVATTAPPAGAAAKPFTPRAIAGSYSGMWTDATFNVSGPFGFTISAKRRNSVLVLGGSVGGQGFGCPGVPPIVSISLTRGKGANHWNAAGFRLVRLGAFGSVDARYDDARHTIRATGTGPPSCAPGVSYRVVGTLRAGVLNGTATITLPTMTAQATFHAERA
jgi:hypothetical protein